MVTVSHLPVAEIVTWVAEIRAGRRETFRRVVERYANAVQAVALAVVGDLDLARDVAQESFWRAYAGLDTLHEPQKFPAWLMAITRKQDITMLRERARERRALVAREVRQSPCAPAEDRPLAAALAVMDAEDREILLLRHIDGHPVEDVAALLGLTYEGARSRLSRARARLATALRRLERELPAPELHD